MSDRVRRVLVLVEHVGFGALLLVFWVSVDLVSDFDSETDVAVRVIEGVLIRSSDYFSSKSSEDISFLLGHFLRHSNDHSVALRSGGHGQTDSSVTGSRF